MRSMKHEMDPGRSYLHCPAPFLLSGSVRIYSWWYVKEIRIIIIKA